MRHVRRSRLLRAHARNRRWLDAAEKENYPESYMSRALRHAHDVRALDARRGAFSGLGFRGYPIGKRSKTRRSR